MPELEDEETKEHATPADEPKVEKKPEVEPQIKREEPVV